MSWVVICGSILELNHKSYWPFHFFIGEPIRGLIKVMPSRDLPLLRHRNLITPRPYSYVLLSNLLSSAMHCGCAAGRKSTDTAACKLKLQCSEDARVTDSVPNFSLLTFCFATVVTRKRGQKRGKPGHAVLGLSFIT